jgi:hypothetical protein
MLAIIKDVVDFVDAKKTLRGVEDVVLTAQAIEQQHPSLTLEELRLACQQMKTGQFGKFYERLKTAEILDALCTFEAKRADHLERKHTAQSVTRGLRPGQKLVPHEPETLTQVMRRRNPLHHVGKKTTGEPTEAQPQKPENHQEPQVPASGSELAGGPPNA